MLLGKEIFSFHGKLLLISYKKKYKFSSNDLINFSRVCNFRSFKMSLVIKDKCPITLSIQVICV